ncbi:MAG TPA: hypothetical protein VHF89_09945 [Solirubrobacteraceae bacterium]|nr:hypothetical protein [Solirubrobacteraceae bacterium]
MRRLIPAALLAALALPASAHATWFPAEPIDGPSADIVSVGDVDVAREGMAAVAFLKRDGGVPHVYVARMFGGSWEPAVRVDQGIMPPASQPVVAAANPDRLAVAWISNGAVFTAVRPIGAPGFLPARELASGGGVSNPSIDLSINGATYVSFTQNGDVKVARADRDRQDFTILPAPVDFDAAREAGTGADLRSRIVASADGTAVVVWGERGSDGRSHVFGRRLFEYRLGQAVEDLTLDEFEGRRATDADRPEVDIEDDSSFAQVAFRQMTDGGPRMVARRLVGSQFEPPVQIDGGQTSNEGRVDLTGRGEGLTATGTTGNEVLGTAIWNNRFERLQRWDSGPTGIPPRPIPLIGENENGAIAWFAGTSGTDATVRGRYFTEVQFLKLEPEVTLSNPSLGGVDVDAGFDGGSTRVSDHVIAFVQGSGAERRLVAAVNDDPPARPLGQNTTGLRRLERFKWASARDLWGPILYRVFVDGRQVGETAATELPVTEGMVPDGRHLWNVVAIDRRGQQTAGPRRVVRIDNTPPLLRASIGRRGRTVGIRVRRFSDRGPQASGISRIVVSFGNGRRTRIARSIRYTYPRGGSFTLRVSGYDKAGNRADVTRTFNIG